MSMTAKLRDLVDKTSEANLQVDGQAEKPAQGAADLHEMEEEDSSPLHWPMWSPTQRPLLGCPNMKHCPGDTSDSNRRIGGHAPTLSFLDGPVGRRYAVKKPELDLLRQ